ncbi:hypothetical protein FNH05_36960 [Amycolatopsis rhizosphaerae]|uniref:Uncharacterized protein n=1 Tax=Amycolatopsis rhizosphaerae TaxID=2053003 RepID=A0A557ZTW0_9PSEU|nr:hypothetical protein [Amycolatopsis rhizosphaerae]TVT15430.1 hypothetical protein FNH05_36960 [Amycolatopsis rhizosphaerae]
MKVGGLALGVGAGYLLGRTRKMRLALMIATGTLGGSARHLVRRGLSELGATEELGKLTDLARDELVKAMKTAAVTAASGRIDALNDRLQQRTLGDGHTKGKGPEEGAEGKAATEEAEERPAEAAKESREAPAPRGERTEKGPEEEREPAQRPAARRRDESGEDEGVPRQRATRTRTAARATVRRVRR